MLCLFQVYSKVIQLYIYRYLFFSQTIFPFMLLQNIEQCFLCYRVGCCWLSIFSTAVYTSLPRVCYLLESHCCGQQWEQGLRDNRVKFPALPLPSVWSGTRYLISLCLHPFVCKATIMICTLQSWNENKMEWPIRKCLAQLCKSLDELERVGAGREVQETEGMCTPMANSCWCMVEMKPIL